MCLSKACDMLVHSANSAKEGSSLKTRGWINWRSGKIGQSMVHSFIVIVGYPVTRPKKTRPIMMSSAKVCWGHQYPLHSLVF